MTRIARHLRRFSRCFRRSEDGSATVEFMVILPIFLILFVSTFELGTVMLRQTMLDRGIDMTVRQVRLGLVVPVEHDILKDMICERAAMLPNCVSELKIEMVVRDPRNWISMSADADCIDLANPTQPPREFVAGAPNQMMLLRACHLFLPYFTDYSMGAFLGDVIPKETGNMYALISTSSYVVEPQ